MYDHEILELFLFDAVPRHNTNPMAHELLDRFGSLPGVFAADKAELMEIHGVGEGVASYIKGTYEEYLAGMRSVFACGRPVTPNQICNYLIWHRMNGCTRTGRDGYITVIALGSDGSVSDVYDTDSISDALENEKARGTYAVAVGVGDVTEDVCKSLCEDGFVRDVIKVKGTDAKSLREEERS